MIKALSRAAALSAQAAAILLTLAAPALSQAPTDAQRSAIRSACRSDYQAHCSSIPPGGMASLQCLQKNMSSLSPSCQSAVRAVETPAEPKAEAKPEAKPESAPAAAAREEPAAAPAKPAAETAAPPKAASTAAKKPSSTQIAAIRSACRSDYQRVCAGVPTGGSAALQCLEKNKSKLSGNCEKAVSAASGGAATPAGAPAAAASASPAAVPAAAPAPALVLRPMRPREILFVLRSACGGDVRALCAGVPAGGGRIIECLATQSASLSPACSDVLGQFAAQ
jgi:Cysteine rich repeat